MDGTTPDDGYSLSMRAVALLGLFFVGAIAYILMDIASNGKLSGGCEDCGGKTTEPEAAGA